MAMVKLRVALGYSAATVTVAPSVYPRRYPTCRNHSSTVLYETYLAGQRNLDVQDLYWKV